MRDAFIGIDLGTSSVKISLVDANRISLGTATRTYELRIGKDGMAEQDPQQWVDGVLDGMQEVISNASDVAIKGIGLTGQWSGTVPVDRDGNAIHDAIIWMDTRGSKEIEDLTGGFPSLAGYRVDKLATWLRITGGAPTHSGKDSLAHILYIKEDLPELYERTYKFLEPKDFIALKLTGKFAASWDNVALLWVTDNRNAWNILYNEKLIQMSGISREKLPLIVKPTDIVGSLKPEISGKIGIRDAKVVSGCGDMQCSLIGAGCVDDFQTLLYLGTSSWITSHVPFKKTDIFHNIASLPSGIPGKYFIAAEQENACNCMEFVSGIMGIDGDEKYSVIDSLSNQAIPGSNGLLFLPWVFGERAPVEDPYLRGGFFNLSLENDRGDFLRSVMEGVALNSKWLLNTVEKFTGRKLEQLKMSGGGSLSPVWVQIISNVLGRKIRVVNDPRFATVSGAAMIAAVGLGMLNFSDLRNMGEPYKEYEPDPGLASIYQDKFNQFLEYFRNNRKSMRKYNAR